MEWLDREGAGVYKDMLAKEKEHLDQVHFLIRIHNIIATEQIVVHALSIGHR